VSPTLIEIGFGLKAKLTIEPATVFGVCTLVVVVGLEVVVVGLAVVVVVGLTVVVDPLVVLAEIGGLVGWLVDDGWTVPSVD
jgi:high-affinity nickel permease